MIQLVGSTEIKYTYSILMTNYIERIYNNSKWKKILIENAEAEQWIHWYESNFILTSLFCEA